jgi:hypothetical protein
MTGNNLTILKGDRFQTERAICLQQRNALASLKSFLENDLQAFEFAN